MLPGWSGSRPIPRKIAGSEMITIDELTVAISAGGVRPVAGRGKAHAPISRFRRGGSGWRAGAVAIPKLTFTLTSSWPARMSDPAAAVPGGCLSVTPDGSSGSGELGVRLLVRLLGRDARPRHAAVLARPREREAAAQLLLDQGADQAQPQAAAGPR